MSETDLPENPEKKPAKRRLKKPLEYDIRHDPDFSDIDIDMFEEMLISALKEQSIEKKYNISCRSAAASIISEFASSYILIGYDFAGKEIEIIRSNSQKDTDALGMFLQRFIPKYFSSMQQES
jgi:hypothetical protein